MEMAEWLRAARTGAPGADLYINDFDLIVRPGSGNPKIPYHMELIGDLKEEGAPLDGFGIQSHFVGILTPIEHVLSMLDDFAATGVKLQITELTINVPDEMTQADYARDFITAAFSCPSVNLIQTWGFWEGRMFEPPAAMFRQNWDPKSLYEKWDRLINETFSSSVSATTDADGTLFFRGFYGTYEFTLPGGKTVQVEFTPDTLEQTL
jgi:GH35 family endo-1,4-beta-xylanase